MLFPSEDVESGTGCTCTDEEVGFEDDEEPVARSGNAVAFALVATEDAAAVGTTLTAEEVESAAAAVEEVRLTNEQVLPLIVKIEFVAISGEA